MTTFECSGRLLTADGVVIGDPVAIVITDDPTALSGFPRRYTWLATATSQHDLLVDHVRVGGVCRLELDNGDVITKAVNDCTLGGLCARILGEGPWPVTRPVAPPGTQRRVGVDGKIAD